jgi:hypothetical protein
MTDPSGESVKLRGLAGIKKSRPASGHEKPAAGRRK